MAWPFRRRGEARSIDGRSFELARVLAAFDAARTTRADLDFNPTGLGPNALAEAFGGLDLVRRKVRHLVDNNDIIAGAVETWEDNVVGTGIDDCEADTGWPEVDKQIGELWEWAVRRVDPERQMSLAESQRLAVRELFIGEVMCHYPMAEAWLAYPTMPAIELIEAERLDLNLTGVLPKGNVVRQGVEYDAQGRTVAYHVLVANPRDNDWLAGRAMRAGLASYIGSPSLKRIPVEDAELAFMSRRIAQLRGVPRAVSVVGTNAQRKRRGLEMVFAARMRPSAIQTLRDGDDKVAKRLATGFGFASPLDAVKCLEEAEGNGLRGRSVMDIARMSIAAANGISYEATFGRFDSPAAFMQAAFHTSSDFPLLLSNAGNKSLLAAFTEFVTVWQEICRTAQATDYKEAKSFSLSEAPNFKLLPEGTNIKEISFNERAEGISVDPFAVGFSYTYQMMRNDDLGAFGRFTEMIGQSGKRVPEDILFALLALNAGLGPTMSDGKTLYHDGHLNIGSQAALSYAAAQADYTLMRKQKGFGKDKAPLDIIPRVLLVALDLQWLAEDLANQDTVPGSASSPSSATQRNQLKGRFKPVATPRLTGTRRYWFGDPSTVPSVEMRFLDGQQTPEIGTYGAPDPMSQRFYGLIRGVGAAAVQHEATLTNAG